ncbi:MAG TPA: iron ABC transporter permease [Gemmatimonadales bacterium]|jgi:iron(III) transport system permease protein|nr:iron ABC transporter permease [Gemmatimonadales bacterium]
MRRTVAWLLLLVLAWLVVEPLVLVAVDAVRIDGMWTLAAVRTFLTEPNEWRAAFNSAWLAMASVVLGCTLGVALGVFTRLADFPGRRVVAALLTLPAVLPPLVGVVAFLFLYGESGVIARLVMLLTHSDTPPWRFEGAAAVLLIHVTTMYVYSYLLVRGALATFDPALLEAATALGATRWRALRTIVLPLLRPAIGNGALLTALSSLASFSAPYVFGGGFRVLPTQLVSTRLNGDIGIAMVETLALVVLSLTALLLASRLSGVGTRGAGKGLAPRPGRSRGPRRLIFGTIAWLVTFWLLLPHLSLLAFSLARPGAWVKTVLPTAWTLQNYTVLVTDPERWRPFGTSLWMATLAALAAAGVALAVAVAARDGRERLSRWLEGGLALPWAVPGTVYAIALATMFSVVQPAAGRFILIGTLWLLPLAYLVRSLPIVGRALVAAIRGLDPALDEAAASLGAGPWRAFVTVTLPLLGPALAGATALAFVTGLGDFMTSVILYTYDTRPVSLEILGAIRDGDLGVAAAYGVALTVLSSGAFLLAERGRRLA